jgi:hypothetical protein
VESRLTDGGDVEDYIHFFKFLVLENTTNAKIMGMEHLFSVRDKQHIVINFISTKKSSGSGLEN